MTTPSIYTRPVTLNVGHALRIAELLVHLADTGELAEESLEGEKLTEHRIERMSAMHWAKRLRDAAKEANR